MVMAKVKQASLKNDFTELCQPFNLRDFELYKPTAYYCADAGSQADKRTAIRLPTRFSNLPTFLANSYVVAGMQG